jgi:hypothetical protein
VVVVKVPPSVAMQTRFVYAWTTEKSCDRRSVDGFPQSFVAVFRQVAPRRRVLAVLALFGL